MSNLSNLYISESYYGVVNLIDSTEPFASQSEARIYLTDGLGENLGLSFNSVKRVSLDNGLTITGSLLVSGSKILTGSLDVLGDITASGTVRAGTGSFDTINARLIHTTIESSSVIYSTGSNIFGDEPSDTQIFSGSVYIPNLHYLGTSSVDTETRIVDLENFSSSLVATFVETVDFNAYTQSTDSRLNQIEIFTSSADNRLNQIEITTASLQNEVNSLIAETGSYARLDSNNTFSGSVNGEVIPLIISATTASMDCSQGNFFTLELVTGVTHLSASNIQPGQTLTLEITQTSTGTGDVTFAPSFNFAALNQPVISTGNNQIDIMTFVTFGTDKLYGVIQNNFS